MEVTCFFLFLSLFSPNSYNTFFSTKILNSYALCEFVLHCLKERNTDQCIICSGGKFLFFFLFDRSPFMSIPFIQIRFNKHLFYSFILLEYNVFFVHHHFFLLAIVSGSGKTGSLFFRFSFLSIFIQYILSFQCSMFNINRIIQVCIELFHQWFK